MNLGEGSQLGSAAAGTSTGASAGAGASGALGGLGTSVAMPDSSAEALSQSFPVHQVLILLLTVACMSFAMRQLLTLNLPRVSGDEAVAFVLLFENFKSILAGQLPPLNPALNYLGPLDIWFLGLPNLFIHLLGTETQTVQTALLRVVPVAFYWIAMLQLGRELQKRSVVLRNIYWTLGLITPMAAMSVRYAWGPALLLGSITLAWAELFYMERTGKARWLRFGIWMGLSIEFHPTTWLAMGILAGSAPRLFWKNFLADRRGFFWGLAIWTLLAFPELRHFPPHIRQGEFRSISLGTEIAGLMEILTGARSHLFLFGKDGIGYVPALVVMLFFVWAVFYFWRGLWRSRRTSAAEVAEPFPRKMKDLFFRHSRAVGAVTLILLYLCYQSHSLRIPGLERYLTVVTPPWIVIFSGAIYWLYVQCRVKESTVYAGLPALSLFALLRFELAIRHLRGAQDPYSLAGKWLEAKCPQSQCLAYAENFWNYWAIRFFTQDRIDVNGIENFHIHHPTLAQGDRALAACYSADSDKEMPFFGRWSERHFIESTDGRPGQICYLQARH